MDNQTLVTPQVKEMFLRHGIPRRFAPGEVLFEKGRPADGWDSSPPDRPVPTVSTPPGTRSSCSTSEKTTSSAPKP